MLIFKRYSNELGRLYLERAGKLRERADDEYTKEQRIWRNEICRLEHEEEIPEPEDVSQEGLTTDVKAMAAMKTFIGANQSNRTILKKFFFSLNFLYPEKNLYFVSFNLHRYLKAKWNLYNFVDNI